MQRAGRKEEKKKKTRNKNKPATKAVKWKREKKLVSTSLIHIILSLCRLIYYNSERLVLMTRAFLEA